MDPHLSYQIMLISNKQMFWKKALLINIQFGQLRIYNWYGTENKMVKNVYTDAIIFWPGTKQPELKCVRTDILKWKKINISYVNFLIYHWFYRHDIFSRENKYATLTLKYFIYLPLHDNINSAMIIFWQRSLSFNVCSFHSFFYFMAYIE